MFLRGKNMLTDRQVYANLGPTLECPEVFYGVISATLILSGLDAGATGLAVAGLLPGASAVSIYKKNQKLQERISEIDANPEKYPLENIDGIIISDVDGLNMLLDKTSKSRGIREWGTYVKAKYDIHTNSADIEQIFPLEESKKMGIKYYPASVKIPRMEGFGTQHYHPKRFSDKLGAWNYAVHNGDRMSNIPGTINLLTFNLAHGPEIIGYNTQYTYIPIDSSKQLLMRADKEQIKKYLDNRIK
jgi:hypothetical protein